MKRSTCIILILLSLFLVGCNNRNEGSDAILFKNEYEYFNKKENPNGQKYRTVYIPESNPMIYSSYSEIISKINAKESFFVFFSFPRCPWCRMYVETLIESANENNIKSIYYVDVYTSRDEYKIDENGKPYKSKEGENGYDDLLNLFYMILDDYTITDENGNLTNVGCKRIYAPNLIFVKAGTPLRLVSDCGFKGDPYSELTESIKQEVCKEYDEIFKMLN